MTDPWWENIEPHVIAMETHCTSASDPTWTTSLMATKAGLTWGIINATKEWLVLPWADLRALEIGESVAGTMTAGETATYAAAGGLIGVAIGRRKKKKQVVTPVIVTTTERTVTFQVFGQTRADLVITMAPITTSLQEGEGRWADAPQTTPQAAGPPEDVGIVGDLSRLAALWESGTLTDDEFAAAKARLLR